MVNMEFSVSAMLSEFMAFVLFMFTVITTPTGVANDPGWVLQVALTFGFAIATLVYAIGHRSGGQINPAITLGLVLCGKLGPLQGVANWVAQFAGSIVGTGFVALVVTKGSDQTSTLASNVVSGGYTNWQAWCGEIIMTFFLVYVVLETATHEKTKPNRALAALAIGLAVFLGHTVLIPIDGCSINPARALGPSLWNKWQGRGGTVFKNFWVPFIGPFVGSILAAGYFYLINLVEEKVDPKLACGPQEAQVESAEPKAEEDFAEQAEATKEEPAEEWPASESPQLGDEEIGEVKTT